MRVSLVAAGFALFGMVTLACSAMRTSPGHDDASGGSGGSPGTGNASGKAGSAGSPVASVGGSNGNDGAAGTPACVDPACPAELPTAGDACSTCDFSPLGCGFDETAKTGWNYTALCIAGQWTVLEQPVPLPTCCATDADCVVTPCDDCPPAVCANMVCERTYPGECWRDDQCAPDQACSGVIACDGCSDGHAECHQYPAAGICVPQGQGCCLSDQDCSMGHCVQGNCKVPAEERGCYTNLDCNAGGDCLDTNVCACGAACPNADAEGHCEYMR